MEQFIGGLLIGCVTVVVMVIRVMPKMMMVTHESRYGFDETVMKIEEAIKSTPGWKHKKTNRVNEEVQRENTNNKDLGVRISGIKLCKGDYAYAILKDEKARFVSCLMPCSISVWEDDSGKVFISEMNIPLMGKMFGGVISKVMAGKVGPEEKEMLKDIIKH